MRVLRAMVRSPEERLIVESAVAGRGELQETLIWPNGIELRFGLPNDVSEAVLKQISDALGPTVFARISPP